MNQNRRKYRVWSEQYKKYLEDQTYLIGNDLILCLGTNGELLGIKDSNNLLVDYNNCEVEQCVGREDKTGQFIYEGDLVRRTQEHWDNCQQKMVSDTYDYIVEWRETGFRIRNIKNSMDTGVIWLPENYSIVGNVHEGISNE